MAPSFFGARDAKQSFLGVGCQLLIASVNG
jgi:hypothetical protein